MVKLNRIYTKTGDAGETSLGDMSRVPKTDSRVRAMGSVDELNCSLGLAIQNELPDPIDSALRQIQNELFDLGADLSCPWEPSNESQLRVTESQVEQLEEWIDELNESLAPLTSFILPGGTAASSSIHLARAIARRAEIDVLSIDESLNPALLKYVNRISDLLFVMARACNHSAGDVLWVPGQSR